ncbi:hypothetical protein GGR51DRAFT_532327 [Nemania sp. FL0031]|nr:hypothetical protein GGR51DRAFT_532327 [Nemania sp. FL0031]
MVDENTNKTQSPNNPLLNSISIQLEPAAFGQDNIAYTTLPPRMRTGLGQRISRRRCQPFPRGVGGRDCEAFGELQHGGSYIDVVFECLTQREDWLHIAIEISHEKAPGFGQGLFKADLETRVSLRYVCLPGGTEIVPNPDVTFRMPV